ncbi:PSD1 and planctomycete cytochrome C domain-containing protein [Verrucomicrobiales bacterium BCK34]|nr:PSD1 and planctomycete cytochrome C domain-containing protein [Verrucomicrobiales bacterium BCK34]
MSFRCPINLLVFSGLLLSGHCLYAVDFEKEVRPIFVNHCFDCHDSQTLKGGIGLETFYHASQGTDAGEPLFVPGKPDDSVLLHVVKEADPAKRMPQKSEALSRHEIATLSTWIAEGAIWPDDGWRPPKHWSYEAPVKAEPASGGVPFLEGRNANEIDHFVAAKLAENNLTLNQPAEPDRLIRRAYLDTIGLPPTPAQVDAFLDDPAFSNYSKIVDELLASPAFGEKWAVQWLDLARYADSEGYQRDSPRSMWPWRDWVIEAINADMPFDQFSIEQLAGDLLPGATESQKVATGFHRNAPMNLEAGTDPEEDHYKRNVDRLNTTSTIWLGSTVACAQCHNHKYDPISAREYYELYAFFNNTPMESKQQGSEMGMAGMTHIGPTMRVSKTPVDLENEKKIATEYRVYLGKIRVDLMEQVDRKIQEAPDGRESLPEEVVKILDSEKEMSLAQCKVISKNIAPRDTLMAVRLENAQIMEARLKLLREKEVRILEEMKEPRKTFIAKRGDFLALGEQVHPATPAALHHFPDEFPRNRLGLAKWLVSAENPLVARAFVNRLWIEIFGQGIVTTPEEFGSQGERPTHPELLDWIAVTFIEEDHWSLKKSLRRILLSATYRQSITVKPDFATVDPGNQLLWRHPGHRLSAETIRDQALAISGLLSKKQLGVHVRPSQPQSFWRRTAGASETYYIPSRGENAYRRGVYTLWRRNAHYPSFANFDAPDRSACVVKRDISNTPLQALTLLNDPVYVEMANAFAGRISKEGGKSLDEQITWAFRTALSREPRETERQLLSSSFESVLGDSKSKQEAYREIATILLNLHETINRS